MFCQITGIGEDEMTEKEQKKATATEKTYIRRKRISLYQP